MGVLCFLGVVVGGVGGGSSFGDWFLGGEWGGEKVWKGGGGEELVGGVQGVGGGSCGAVGWEGAGGGVGCFVGMGWWLEGGGGGGGKVVDGGGGVGGVGGEVGDGGGGWGERECGSVVGLIGGVTDPPTWSKNDLSSSKRKVTPCGLGADIVGKWVRVRGRSRTHHREQTSTKIGIKLTLRNERKGTGDGGNKAQKMCSKEKRGNSGLGKKTTPLGAARETEVV